MGTLLRPIRILLILAALLVLAGGVVAFPRKADAGADTEFVVYSIYKGLDLGDPNDPPQKDYFINMGTTHGLHRGAHVEVYRRAASYDLASQKLYQDVTFPIAKLRIIHVEEKAAIGRLEKMHPAQDTPAIVPRTVMVGDLVRLGR